MLDKNNMEPHVAQHARPMALFGLMERNEDDMG
jgi:hypothetical protein